MNRASLVNPDKIVGNASHSELMPVTKVAKGHSNSVNDFP